MGKKSGFLLLEYMVGQSFFIIFITSFIASSGYLLTAHYTIVKRIFALEELVMCRGKGVQVSNVSIALTLYEEGAPIIKLQGQAGYFVSSKNPSYGILANRVGIDEKKASLYAY